MIKIKSVTLEDDKNVRNRIHKNENSRNDKEFMRMVEMIKK